MVVYGLTGGIGCGKSAASSILAEWDGVEIIDTDLIAREVTSPGRAELQLIVATFGGEILAQDGTLDRRQLAGRVFGDERQRKILEEILHPAIRREWTERVRSLRQDGNHWAIVVVVPLLFETRGNTEVNRTICAACSVSTQRARLSARGWTESEIDARLRAQWPLKAKIEAADHILWNEFTLGVLTQQLERVVTRPKVG
jgi:dephospho-CoA kinase